MQTLQEGDKLHKRMLAEQQKRMRPGDCLKYITTLIDGDILKSRFGSQITGGLANVGVTWSEGSPSAVADGVPLRLLPGTVCWRRTVQRSLVDRDGKLGMDNSTVDEDHVLLFMFAPQLADQIKGNTLLDFMQSMQKQLPEKQITLLVCGLADHLVANRQLTRLSVERSMTRLQLLAGISHRLLETAADVANTVVQFTKAVAEAPFKKQQNDRLVDQNFYVANDNKDCVAVRGNIGLSKLWQHHLIKMPMAQLETAEAIIAEYPMPRLLLNEYETTTDGANLLANIPVRRAGGPLTSVRKIGPEMSRRIHALYTNDDPEFVI